jgi:hypothetical protein
MSARSAAKMRARRFMVSNSFVRSGTRRSPNSSAPSVRRSSTPQASDRAVRIKSDSSPGAVRSSGGNTGRRRGAFAAGAGMMSECSSGSRISGQRSGTVSDSTIDHTPYLYPSTPTGRHHANCDRLT